MKGKIMNINDKFKTSVNNTKEAEANIIELLKPVYENEKAKVKLINELALGVADWIILASQPKKNDLVLKQLPTLDQVKDKLKQLAKSIVPTIKDVEKGTTKADEKEISRLSGSISDASKTALLLTGEDTGFVIGYRLADGSAYVDENKAIDKRTGKLKSQFVKDIFAEPIKTFPMQNIGTAKEPKPRKNFVEPDTFNNVFMRKAFEVHFENKALNELEFDVHVEPREKEGHQYSISNADGSTSFKGIKAVLEALIQKMEDGDLEALGVKAQTNDNGAKHCLEAFKKFNTVYNNKIKEFELANKQAEEQEKLEAEAKRANIKKAS
jgi:hypothetical protein